MADLKTELTAILRIMEEEPEKYIQEEYESECGTQFCAAGWVIYREYRRMWPEGSAVGLREQVQVLGYEPSVFLNVAAEEILGVPEGTGDAIFLAQYPEDAADAIRDLLNDL